MINHEGLRKRAENVALTAWEKDQGFGAFVRKAMQMSRGKRSLRTAAGVTSAVRQATDEARQRRALETLMTDPSIIELEIQLAEYRPSKSAAPQYDVRKVVRWTGLRYDAETFREVSEVQNLETVVRRLSRLAEVVEQSGSRAGGAR